MSTLFTNSVQSHDGAPVRFPNGINTNRATSTIGTAGELGFGVGTFANSARFGLFPLASAEDPDSPTLGNYQSSNGSIFVCIPKFFYRIGHASNATYGAYGVNSIEIAGTDRFVNEAAANASGFAMPRAFKDGGREVDAFFYFKYFASKDGNTVLSLPNTVPISLTTDTDYTRSAGMTDCVGQLHDAITLARTVIPGFTNATTLFQRSALALLSLAHGQAATSTAACAWYDASGTTNFPKGCNDSALGDKDDGDIVYVTAGDAGSASKPLTGSGAPFNRTTHNGQASGIADLNGVMWEVALGVTSPGSSSGDSAIIANGTTSVLKPSVAVADLLNGWTQGGVSGDVNNAWGDATHLATLYDEVTDFQPWADATAWIYVGNGSNQVFDPALSGDGWLRTAAGLPKNTDAMSASGTNLFGNDGIYRYNRANMFPLCGGTWLNSRSGVFAQYWDFFRTNSGDGSVFVRPFPPPLDRNLWSPR